MITALILWLLASPVFALMCGKAIHIRDTKETFR